MTIYKASKCHSSWTQTKPETCRKGFIKSLSLKVFKQEINGNKFKILQRGFNCQKRVWKEYLIIRIAWDSLNPDPPAPLQTSWSRIYRGEECIFKKCHFFKRSEKVLIFSQSLVYPSWPVSLVEFRHTHAHHLSPLPGCNQICILLLFLQTLL